MRAVKMTAVGFEPTQLALVELESTPLDHSGKLSLSACVLKTRTRGCQCYAGGVLFGQAGHIQADRVYICRYMCARTFCVWADAKPSSKKEKEKERCVCLVWLCVVLVARESKKLTDSCGI